jgi:hypothetical protein
MAREWVSALRTGLWPPPGGAHEAEGGAWWCAAHSPLVKRRGLAATRRKYPWVTLLEVDREGPADGPPVVLADRPGTVVLLPYEDLVRYPAGLSPAVGPCCTLAFCPDAAFKPLARALRAALADPAAGPGEDSGGGGGGQDLRGALLCAARELNRVLGLPVVVLSHAWRSAPPDDEPAPTTHPAPAPPPATPPTPAVKPPIAETRLPPEGGRAAGADARPVADLRPPGGAAAAAAKCDHDKAAAAASAAAATVVAAAAAAAAAAAHIAAGPGEECPAHSAAGPGEECRAPAQRDAAAGTGGVVAWMDAAAAAAAEGRGGAGGGLCAADGLVHTPLEVSPDATRRAFVVHRAPRPRRREPPHPQAPDKPAGDAAAARAPRTGAGGQAAEQQELSRRVRQQQQQQQQHALASARLRGVRGRMLAEMSAAHGGGGGGGYESGAVGASELSDAATAQWAADSESSGWATSAEPTPCNTSAEPTPRSVGAVPGVAAVGEVISEGEEDWDDEAWLGRDSP